MLLWFRCVVPMFIIRLFDNLSKLKKGHHSWTIYVGICNTVFNMDCISTNKALHRRAGLKWGEN